MDYQHFKAFMFNEFFVFDIHHKFASKDHIAKIATIRGTFKNRGTYYKVLTREEK